jgi:membrane-bound lytic murein transglycosylase D
MSSVWNNTRAVLSLLIFSGVIYLRTTIELNTMPLKTRNRLFNASGLYPALICLLVLASCVHDEAMDNQADSSTEPVSDDLAALALAPDSLQDNNSPGLDLDARLSDEFAIGEIDDHSLWNHMRAGFVLESGMDQQRTQNELDWYSSHRDYLARVMDRAEPFLDYILVEAEKRHLPSEMVLLPIVESAFQPFAYSHGRAAGLWQFIPSTGKIYGLKQDWWYDGRRDIHASTQAALDYLENLGQRFNGDWLLALAAYNAGSGNVRRAIRENERRGKATDFWHLNLPRETQAYVPKLLALKEIITNPGLYDVSLHCIPLAPGFKVVDAGAQIDLALAAELADIDTETLYMYNPAFNRWATPPDGPHQLILPTEAALIFEQNLKALPDDQRLSWKRHPIGKGETLSQIAVKYRTTVEQLRKVNKIRGNNIRAGHHLLIPVASRDRSAYSLSASQRRQTTQNISRGDNKTKVSHTVQPGESFWQISRAYNVNMQALAKWNGMAVRDPLRDGQQLVVWQKTAMTSAPQSLPSNGASLRTISYTVRNGDSLSRIADRYRVSVDDLERWNNIEGKYLQPGQKLKLLIDVRNQG